MGGKFYARRGGPTGSVLVQESPGREKLRLRGKSGATRETGSQATLTGKCEFSVLQGRFGGLELVALWPSGQGEV